MPKKQNQDKRPIGIPAKVYQEIEEYARSQSPELFLFEVVELAWECLKKGNIKLKKA